MTLAFPLWLDVSFQRAVEGAGLEIYLNRTTCYPKHMNPKELAAHKSAPKRMATLPSFKAMKRGKLPKPLHKMGGPRLQGTEVVEVSDTHRAIFMWRDGEQRTDRAFYAYLFCVLETGELHPLFEMHFHPSHKGLHAKLPCKTQYDYASRFLPGAPELGIKSPPDLDPNNELHRNQLIDIFCSSCGIKIGSEGGLWN